jgi:formate-dependent nitrite reductase membrane component NrfD
MTELPDDAPTYYDRPLLKAPHWEWNVVTYLFMGGVMGGLGLIQLLADPKRDGDKRLRRSVRIASLALAAANPGVLITHLGRPERFLHMLRIVKLKSPMSLGVWGLVFYSGAAGANVIGLLPQLMTPIQASLGAFIAGYTGVLLSATANPFWSSGKVHIPAASVCSGMASACALSSLISTIEGNDAVVHRLERLEMVASIAELTILNHFERRSGVYGKPFFEGKRGRRLRTYTIGAGIVAPLALNILGTFIKLPKPANALRVAAASMLTMVGGYILRECLIEAGKDSARNPHVASRQPK